MYACIKIDIYIGIFKRGYPCSNLRSHLSSSCPPLNKGKENSAGDCCGG